MDISNANGAYRFVYGANYVVAGGKKLWIFLLNGQLVACREDFQHIHKMAILPNERVLVEDAQKYELISLKDGSSIWNVSKFKRDYSYSHFSISPAFDFAYSIDMRRDTPFATKINLADGKVETHQIKRTLRTTNDFMCDSKGGLCVLQTHYTYVEDGTIGENVILRADFEKSSLWKKFSVSHNWQFVGEKLACNFVGNTETILTNDLHIYLPASKTIYSAVENSPEFRVPKQPPSFCNLDVTGRYLQLGYIWAQCDVVIDLQERRAVAQYAMPNGLPGCVVGEEYWTSSSQGILRKRFPVWEEMPLRKLTTMFSVPPEGTSV